MEIAGVWGKGMYWRNTKENPTTYLQEFSEIEARIWRLPAVRTKNQEAKPLPHWPNHCRSFSLKSIQFAWVYEKEQGRIIHTSWWGIISSNFLILLGSFCTCRINGFLLEETSSVLVLITSGCWSSWLFPPTPLEYNVSLEQLRSSYLTKRSSFMY